MSFIEQQAISLNIVRYTCNLLQVRQRRSKLFRRERGRERVGRNESRSAISSSDVYRGKRHLTLWYFPEQWISFVKAPRWASSRSLAALCIVNSFKISLQTHFSALITLVDSTHYTSTAWLGLRTILPLNGTDARHAGRWLTEQLSKMNAATIFTLSQYAYNGSLITLRCYAAPIPSSCKSGEMAIGFSPYRCCTRYVAKIVTKCTDLSGHQLNSKKNAFGKFYNHRASYQLFFRQSLLLSSLWW